MTSIERQANARWRARYRTPSGESRSRTFELKKDATKFLLSKEHEKESGLYVDVRLGRTTVASWADTWMETVEPALTAKTAASYRSLLRSRVLPTFGRRQLATLKPSDVQGWVAAMRRQGLSASRIRQAVVLLRQMLEAAMRDGMVGRNACAGVKLPKLPSHEAPYFEPQTVEAIAEAVGPPYDLLVDFLGTCGLRWGEAAALRRKHVDVLRQRLVVEESLAEVSGQLIFGSTKSHSQRSVPVPKSLMERLETALEDKGPDELVFTSPQGEPLRYRNFLGRVWHPALKRLGLSVVGVHALRHSAAAGIVAAGGSAKTLQVVLGHRTAAFSLTVYAHLFDSDLDRLAERLETARVSSVSRLDEYRRAERQK